MKKMIRAFIAISLPEDVRAELGLVSETLAGQMPPRVVRWVKPSLMHVTLRFLGDTAVSQLPLISSELDRIAACHAPINLHVGGLGCFPNRKRPRVIWAGLRGDMTAVQALKRDIDAILEPLGWKREKRPFRPHLTLGRVKDGRKLRGIEWGTEVKRMVVLATAVHLIESQLQPDGPVYTVRHTSRLNQKHP
ncbi:MAG: RNA 2',3'-cyclic phosphodiesterase [Chloroflexi bacterium]|nr:RNA 2',3'-cyclic phosphodiesterase [Chloroflexota bacterium]